MMKTRKDAEKTSLLKKSFVEIYEEEKHRKPHFLISTAILNIFAEIL